MEAAEQPTLSASRTLLTAVSFLSNRRLQAISEQLAARKEEVAEAIRSTEVFLLSRQASK